MVADIAIYTTMGVYFLKTMLPLFKSIISRVRIFRCGSKCCSLNIESGTPKPTPDNTPKSSPDNSPPDTPFPLPQQWTLKRLTINCNDESLLNKNNWT